MIKLLIIDDEPGVAESMARTFTYMGFEVSTAHDGAQARDIVALKHPQIVFLDLVMPGIHGLDLLAELKKKNRSIIVIVITAVDDEAIRAEAMKRGADVFLRKPFSHNTLRDIVIEKVKNLLEHDGKMKRPVVLLVDDEDEFRSEVRHFLGKRFDCDIKESADADDALAKTKALAPDVILLDVKMPGASGLDVVEKMRALSPESRILIVSAWKSGEVVAKAIELGAEDYLAKPVSLVALGEKLKSVFLSQGKLIQK